MKPTTIPSKRLSESINGESTSFRLNNILTWDGQTDLTSTDFGDRAFCVFRNDLNTVIEIMEIDPSTIAAGDISILKRGLKFDGDLTTEVSANKLTWIKNETIVELGTDTPQLFQWLKEYIDEAAFNGGVDASDTAKGVSERATQSEVDNKSTNGSTGPLFVSPRNLRSTKYNDYVLDTGSANAYVITPSPAITSYEAGQEFTFRASNTNTLTSTINVNGLGVKTIRKNGTQTLAAGDIKANQIYKVVYDGTDFQIVSNFTSTDSIKFGGNGSDGALSISSGTTNIDVGGARIFVRNYSSISITGTGKLTFSNPHSAGTIIILHCSGNVTLTSSQAPMIDDSAMGAEGGLGGYDGLGNIGTRDGSTGTSYTGTSLITTNPGQGGTASTSTAGTAATLSAIGISNVDIMKYLAVAFCGSGGGGGYYNASNGGASRAGNGGRGGGCLIIECAGAFNFTTTNGISVAGANGTVGTATSSSQTNGGGGGGGGGFFMCLYNTLTNNTGSVTISGGVGANTSATNGTASRGGGGGASISAGSNGASATNGNKSGGDGATGVSLIAANTEFV